MVDELISIDENNGDVDCGSCVVVFKNWSKYVESPSSAYFFELACVGLWVVVESLASLRGGDKDVLTLQPDFMKYGDRADSVIT